MTQSVTHGMPKGESKCLVRKRGRAVSLLTFGEQAVHHAADELEFVLKRKVDEVGIDENTVWRYKGVVVLQEQR